MNKAISALIVDDHDGMRATLQDILEDEGYQVSIAASGLEAIDFCKNKNYDFILLDVKMPGIDGVETFKRIKTISSSSRVIMMSANSVDQLKLEALKEGAIAFLQKPLDISQVLKLLEEAENAPVLIVTEDQEERNKILNTLKNKPYRTHVTHSPDQAIEMSRQIHFSLIIIDTKLAPINGLELYLALKQISPRSVTIMLADEDQSFIEQAKEAIQNNAYTFIKKPLQTDNLVDILDRIRKQLNSNFVQKPGFPG
jgi:DNA-binding NtrC family response regulator